MQLQGLASTFPAFTPEWAAAKAAFAGVDVGARRRTRRGRRRSPGGNRTPQKKTHERRVGTGDGDGDEVSVPVPVPVPSPSPGTTVRSLLETESLLDFDDAASRYVDAPAPDNLTLNHPSLVEYVQGVLHGVKDGSIDESTADAAFEMRRGAKTPSELRALAGEGFWSALAEGLPEDAFDALAASLVGAEAFAAASRENDTSSEDGSGTGLGSGSGSGSDSRSDSRASDAKRRARLESIAAQLSDVEPKFDFEVSVIARPIVSTLFRGWAARSWTHAALRLAPDEITPYAYADPLALAAADLYPEVAAAYVRSLRDAGTSDEEIRRKLRDAINVRFVVSVIVVARKQISVGGGDILRNVFTLTL